MKNGRYINLESLISILTFCLEISDENFEAFIKLLIKNLQEGCCQEVRIENASIIYEEK